MTPKHVFACICILNGIIYLPGIANDFVGIDDDGQVKNPNLHPLSLENVRTLFSSETVSMYQPLTSLSFAVLIACFGRNGTCESTYFHLFGLALHTLNGMLVYRVFDEVLDDSTMAIAISMIFTVHPLQVESVSWVSATSTLQFSSFYLLSMLFYLRYLRSGSRRQHVLSVGLFVCSCLSKICAINLCAVLFLLDAQVRGWRCALSPQSFRSKAPYACTTVVFVCIALFFRTPQTAVTPYPMWSMCASQLRWYVVKVCLPVGLTVLYPWPLKLNLLCIARDAVFVVLLITFACRQRTIRLFGLCFYIANIALHTSLISSFLGPFADRYAYLSICGICLFLLQPLSPVRIRCVCALIIPVLVAMSCAQTTHWSSTTALWSKSIDEEPSSFAFGMRGALHYQRNDWDAARADFDRFLAQPDLRFDQAKFAYILHAQAIMYRSVDKQRAIGYMQQCLHFNDSPAVFHKLAQLFIEQGDVRKAKLTMEDARRRHPKDRETMRLAQLLQG